MTKEYSISLLITKNHDKGEGAGPQNKRDVICRQSLTRVSRIWIAKFDETLWIFGEVFEVGLLNAAGVETGLPSPVEGDLLIHAVADVANVQSLNGSEIIMYKKNVLDYLNYEKL